MKSPFKELMGHRVLIPFPKAEEKKGKVILLEGASAAQEAELIKKYLRITVIQIGGEVTRVKPGDEIFVPARCLAPGRADAVQIDGKMYYIMQEVDIAAVY
jgi:co-chaperonin GroES (HSP10)